LLAVVQGKVGSTTPIPFLCECADETCTGRVEITATEYERIHANPGRFAVAVGHPILDSERVVDETSGLIITEKAQ
jgi:hypothetical protein